MFSELALIDWIALAFAAVLLAAAAAAAIVAYATSKNRSITPKAVAGHRPAHAAVSSRATEKVASGEAAPVKADAERIPPPPTLVSAGSVVVPIASGEARSAVVSNGVRIESSRHAHAASSAHDAPIDAVAERAARLRRRPHPEHSPSMRKRIVSAVEPKRMPAHAPNRGVVETVARPSRLSIDMDTTEGFAARTPGFFEDPVGRHELRYWDGHRWTEYVKELGERFTDPL